MGNQKDIAFGKLDMSLNQLRRSELKELKDEKFPYFFLYEKAEKKKGKKVKGKTTTTVQGSKFTDKEKNLASDLESMFESRRGALREAIKKALNGIKQRASK